MLKIKQKRIRTLKKYIPFLKQSKKIIISVDKISHQDLARKIGFSQNLTECETVLPSVIGSITAFNAEGKDGKKRKDLPMETHYRQVEWTWKQWSGRGQTQTMSKIADVPYKKYQRYFIAPPSIEMRLIKGMIASSTLNYPTDESLIIHTINLFLEIFGECEIRNENLGEIINIETKKLNWILLPEGKMPWEKIKKEMEPALKRANSQEKTVFRDRFDTINTYKPNFYACGLAGFSGYIIFGFEKRKLYICESIWHGNAIYVFQEDWRELSKKTKAEILRGNLHKERIIHYEDWKSELRRLLISNNAK